MRTLLALALVSATGFAAQPLVEGNPASSVRVVIYEDLQCPDCAGFRQMLDDKLLPAYGAKVAFEHRDFPLAKHAWARKAATASRFFQDAGAEVAIAFRRQLMQNIKATRPETLDDRIAAFAREKGLDAAQAVAAADNPEYAAAVEKDFQNGIARGVSKTPTAFVNGVPFIETFTCEEIAKAIDAALPAAGK